MLRLRTFGSVDLQGSDGEDLRPVLAQPKRLALLIYLAAARPAGVHRRDDLLARFWPDLDDTRARDALNQALRFLRQSLGPETFVRRGGEDVGVDPERLWCDAVAFRVAAAGGRPAEALELYRGEFLRGFFVEEVGGFEEWMEGERAACREAASRAARDLAEDQAAEGAFTQAIAWGKRALELAPDDERALRRLLRWYDRAGDRAGAFRTYEAFARRFQEEFGSEPSAETRAMVELLRAGKPLDEERKPGVAASPRPAPAAPTVSQTLRPLEFGGMIGDQYRILRKLGAGGMAVVYLAQDLKHDREVALKVLRPEIAEGLARERFIREIRIAGRLQHPNIVPMFDSGEADGRLFYVMPHVQGETLREKLRRERKLPIEEAVHLVREVAGALGYAHEQGVVHRDIKPENVLLIDRRAVLTDFGIARAAQVARAPAEAFDPTLTQPGTSLGTPGYMAPEQAAGKADVDHRADLYALGVLAYEMLAGRTPFTGAAAHEILAAQLTETATPIGELRPEVPAGVASVVMGCLARKPDDRLSSAQQVIEWIDGPGLPPTDRPFREAPVRTDSIQADTKSPRSSRRRFAVGVGVLGAVMAGAMIALKLGGSLPTTSRAPEEAAQIAVRPFVDLSSDQSLRHIADGLSNDLISELSSISVLHVRSATAIAPLRNAPPDSIRRALGVGTLVEGIISGDNDSLRLNVAIVLARGGDQLAHRKWAVPRDRVLALEDSLASEVGAFVRDWLGSEITTQRQRLGTRNAQAWEHYQMGTAAYQEAGRLYKAGETVPAFKLMVVADSLLAQAQAADPRWLDPMVQRGWLAYWRAGSTSATMADTAAAWSRRAVGLAEEVLAAREDHAEAHELRGTAYLYLTIIGRGDSVLLAKAEADLRSGAVDTNPAQARAWQSLARVLRMRGQPAEANVAAQRAYDLDPYQERAQKVLEDLCATSFELNRSADSRRWCGVGRKRFPSASLFPYFALQMLSIAPPEGATADSAWALLQHLQHSTPPAEVPSSRPAWQMMVAGALARAGLKDSARRVLSSARLAGTGKPDLDVYEAAALTALGDQEAALDRLDAYLRKLPMMRRTVGAHPSFASLTENRRFRTLVGEPQDR